MSVAGRLPDQALLADATGKPVADVLVYVPDEDLFAPMGLAVGGSLDTWREARKVTGRGDPRSIRRAWLDFDLIDDDALAVLPSDTSRPMIISGVPNCPMLPRTGSSGSSPRGAR